MERAAIAVTPLMSPSVRAIWRCLQSAVWAFGMFIWGALIIEPDLGLHLLWNVLIPVAPALLVLAPGVWRNVCPLGTMSMAPHHLKLSKRKQLSPVWRGRLYLGAFVLLMLVVPFRKVLLDTNGAALAAVLGVVGLLAITLGLIFDWKSAWCSSLCPVYPVELLYGSAPVITPPNTHCSPCSRCVAPCSESKPGVNPRTAIDTPLGRAVGTVLTGCFPGFVWGWNQVATYSGWEGLNHLHLAYGIPYISGGATLALYLTLRKLSPTREKLVARIFAATAIITYYWFRLPPMFGIGNPDLAMVVDVSGSLPVWSATAMRILVVAFFGWLLVGRTGHLRAWSVRPPFATEMA